MKINLQLLHTVKSLVYLNDDLIFPCVPNTNVPARYIWVANIHFLLLLIYDNAGRDGCRFMRNIRTIVNKLMQEKYEMEKTVTTRERYVISYVSILILEGPATVFIASLINHFELSCNYCNQNHITDNLLSLRPWHSGLAITHATAKTTEKSKQLKRL